MAAADPVRRLRIVVGGTGPDHIDDAVRAASRVLRDAGHEVIFTGLHQSPEQVAETALQEDADLVGLPGADPDFVARVARSLADHDADDIVVGAPGATTDELLRWVAEAERRG